MNTRSVVIVAIIFVLIAASTFTVAQLSTPSMVRLLGSFDAFEVWGSFGLLAAGPIMTESSRIPLVCIEDSTGHAVAFAKWDGKGPELSSDGGVWVMHLIADLEGQKITYELRSSFNADSKLVNGTTEIALEETSGLGLGSEYTHTLMFAGSDAIHSEKGTEAVLSSVSETREALLDLLVFTSSEESCMFTRGTTTASDKTVDFIEARAHLNTAKCADQGPIMTIFMTTVKAWSPEPALDLAKAMNGKDVSPDLRIMGSVDKVAASPGEDIEYTYHIFNAGMEEAVDLEVNIPIPEGTELVFSSLEGSEGRLRLIPSGEVFDILSTSGVTHTAGKGVTSMLLTPRRPLLPGGTFTVSFKVII